MPLTHKLIASTTITSATSTVTLSSIPSTYDHLYIKVSIRTNRNVDGYADVSAYFNSDTGSNYKTGAIQGTGNGTVGNIGTNTNQTSAVGNFLMQSVQTSTTGYQYYFANGDIFIPNYRSSNVKIGRWESWAPWNTSGIHRMGSVAWSGTAAITSITFKDENAATMQPYSTFTLYGLTNS